MALTAVACCLASSSLAAQPLVKLNPQTCRPLPAEQMAWLGAEWTPYQAFTKFCEVKYGKSAALYLVSVWADDFYATKPASDPAVKFPKPILAGPDGMKFGELPMNFPRDPPRTLSVTFARWTGGFPHEIRLWVEDPTVVGDHSLRPLEWDATSQTFRTSKSKEKLSNGHRNR